MEGNFQNSTYNRKSNTVVKKPVQWIFIMIVQYVLLIQPGINQTVHKIGT